jgi:tetratricopeptide (TPR) repeat protein
MKLRLCTLFYGAALIVFVLAAMALFTPAHAATDAAAIKAAKTALQAAVDAGSTDGILAARGQFDALSTNDPGNAVLHYWVAACDWRVTPFFMGEDTKAKGKRWVDEGIARATKAYELDPKFGEALALRCGLMGLSLQFDASQTMKLGIQMEGDMSHAKDLAPKNPRVALLDGINTLYKPAFVGGGAGQARTKFEKAGALFAAETVTDPAAPDWGKDDVWTWDGRAAMKAGDSKGAVEAYKKALAANPNNGWVRHSLLPEAEKKLAAN